MYALGNKNYAQNQNERKKNRRKKYTHKHKIKHHTHIRYNTVPHSGNQTTIAYEARNMKNRTTKNSLTVKHNILSAEKKKSVRK